MHKLTPIPIPLLNTNEPEALLVSLEAAEGDELTPDQVIAVIETTKSTGEIRAEASGYLVGLRFSKGDTLHAGDVLAYIGDSPDARDLTLPPWAPVEKAAPQAKAGPDGLRITAPARKLAEEHGLNLESLPHGPLVTRQMVSVLIAEDKMPEPIPKGEKRVINWKNGDKFFEAVFRTNAKDKIFASIITYFDEDVKSPTVSEEEIESWRENNSGIR